MPQAARKGHTANHVPPDGWSVHAIDEGSKDVFINGEPAAVKGDKLTDHSKGDTVHFPGAATPVIEEGSEEVYINDKEAARKGDPVDCSSEILEGSEDVIFGPEET